MNILARSTSPRCASNRRRAVVVGSILALLVCGSAAAQFGPSIEVPPGLPTVMPAPVAGYPPTVAATSVGTYLARPAWSQTPAPNVRFLILGNFNSDAVLDRATGLVWTRHSLDAATATNSPVAIQGAEFACETLTVGNRMGWRLPAPSELLSLMVIDASQTNSGQPKLPAGHPFLLSDSPLGSNIYFYWTSGITNSDDIYANEEDTIVRMAFDLASGSVSLFPADGTGRLAVLCVRGSKGVL